MALHQKGRQWHGSGPEDIQAEILRFSRLNALPATQFRASACPCGHHVFKLESDEDAGAARRTCAACGTVHWMGDSAEYADGAQLDNHECLCDGEEFQLVTGVALHDESPDVRWCYIGCRCMRCHLVGVFAHWKCEAGDAEHFLAAV